MPELFERVLPTDRWPNRAISPLPFSGDYDAMPVVVVHPGWDKRPEMLGGLLMDLTDAGFRAIGLDTRYGYTDQLLPPNASLKQRMRVGPLNQFFDDTDTTKNRYLYRRPTGVLQACVDLGIEECFYVGHSEGGRIGLTAALADLTPVKFKGMVIVNGVGTGRASGMSGMWRANLQAVRQRRGMEASRREALMSFRDSAVHFVTHPRRTKREASVIHGYDAWADIDLLLSKLDFITVMNARDDHLISFEDAQAQAAEHPEVHFIPTEGSHSNIYQAAVRKLVVAELAK